MNHHKFMIDSEDKLKVKMEAFQDMKAMKVKVRGHLHLLNFWEVVYLIPHCKGQIRKREAAKLLYNFSQDPLLALFWFLVMFNPSTHE